MLKQMIDRIWSGGTSPDDAEVYAFIHSELSSGRMDPGLWTKALALSDGSTDKAKSRYIEMRANFLRQERRKLLEIAKQTHRESQRAEKLAVEQERRSRELQYLEAEKTNLLLQRWEKFDSPKAKNAKRRRSLRNTAIYVAFCGVVYMAWSDNELFVLPIFIGFFAWIFSLATYGRVEIDSQLGKVLSRIRKLNGGNA